MLLCAKHKGEQNKEERERDPGHTNRALQSCVKGEGTMVPFPGKSSPVGTSETTGVDLR